MITAIEIENFKAFGERQRIELRPITLLFGPNSGGKSSVSHALHYLREVIVEGNIDAHRTWSGGDVLDLGGIRNFVHGRQLGTIIKLKAEFSLNGAELPTYVSAPELEDLGEDYEERIRGLIQTASVELEIDTAGEPALVRYTVELNGAQIAEMVMEREKPHAEIRSINWHHPILLLDKGDREIAEVHIKIGLLRQKLKETMEAKGWTEDLERLIKEEEQSAHSDEYGGALASLLRAAMTSPSESFTLQTPKSEGPTPNFNAVLLLPSVAETAAGVRISVQPLSEEGQVAGEPFEVPSAKQAAALFTSLLSLLLLGPGAVLGSRLRQLRYVGPLRAMPPRQVEPPDNTGRSRWPTGLQAWDTLAYGDNALLDELTKWLEMQDRLDTGYRLERQTFKQVASRVIEMLGDPDYFDVVEELATEIKGLPEQTRVVLRDVGRNLQLQPQDVGVGLSQIVPVMVALLDDGSPLVALEQPELHLHPRQQAALGDALIHGSLLSPDRVLLVETHSEHLILRLLRRIRETTRKQVVSEGTLSPAQLRVQYVRREGSASKVNIIDVDVNGDLVDPWPDDFFEQDFKERFS